MIWAIIIGVVLLALIAAFLRSRRGSADGVESFQRQIDALSSEARRPVVDQVQRVTIDDEDDEEAG